MIVLVLVLVLAATTPVAAYAEGLTGEVLVPIVVGLLAPILAFIGGLLRLKFGKGSLVKSVSDTLSGVYSQAQVDKAVEVALAGRMSPKLADVIGDLVSTIAKLHLNGESLPVLSYVKAFVNQLRDYSPDILSKIFSGLLDQALYDNAKRESLLTSLSKSTPLVDAIHQAVHSVNQPDYESTTAVTSS
jgi:hypothetical protein